MVQEGLQNRPSRVLLVGAGRMGLGHLKELLKVPQLATVVGGVDQSPEARQRLQAEYGISLTFADLKPALASMQCDAAIISVPNFLHAEYALTALGAGLHVFIEKPMALTLADVDTMVRTAERQGRLLMAGQTLRFVGPLRYVKRLIDAGAIGTVRHVLHRRMGAGRGGDERSWFARQEQSGGILPGIGVHSLDILLWWLGERAISVYAVVQNIDPHPDVDIEDEASLVATSQSGAVINAAFSFHHEAGTDWIAAGSDGVITLNGNSGPLLLNGEVQDVPDIVELPGERQIQREFLAAIRDHRPLAQAAGAEVRHVMALIFAAQESGRTGQSVVVP